MAVESNAEGVPFDDPDALSDEERAALEALLFALADDELVLAERYTEWQVRAPTLESDLALANIAQDELGHARLWYDLLEDLGYTESWLLFDRDSDEFRHSTLSEQPFPSGDWADAIVRGLFYDEAEALRLEALEGSAHPRIAGRVGKIQQEERYHREHAKNWIERLVEDDEGRERVQAAVDRLFPYALTLFVPTDHEESIVELGLRTESLDDLREEWLDRVVPYLGSLGIDAPINRSGEVTAELPENVGRDGSHGPEWAELHDDMTRSYRALGRDYTHQIMPKPDDE